MSSKYMTLNNYSQNTLTREDRQDTTVSKCMGGVCPSSARPNNTTPTQNVNEGYEEQYGAFSLRSAVRAPYSQYWGSTGNTCKNPVYDAVS